MTEQVETTETWKKVLVILDLTILTACIYPITRLLDALTRGTVGELSHTSLVAAIIGVALFLLNILLIVVLTVLIARNLRQQPEEEGV